ncbi:UNVERIFIED_CONTAM: hypothetical protein Sradi_2683100 [Sesamum radiatum]|uniref:Uncharacterized protein n=1 Tax=Sesamum radiatum TaxID=300843 RepID=A0AAW2S6P4_SESRA
MILYLSEVIQGVRGNGGNNICRKSFLSNEYRQNRIANKMDDEWLNDLMACYIELEIFADINDEVILQHFQNMKTRRFQLAPRSQTVVAKVQRGWRNAWVLHLGVASSPPLDSGRRRSPKEVRDDGIIT